MSHLKEQLDNSLNLLQKIFGVDLLGVYLYGSASMGGLERYSDIDLFVVINRASSLEEKSDLVSRLLKISGIYMKSNLFPIELTMVVQSEINPWKYPPQCDFQYGEWLREHFISGNIEASQSKDMPDLAILITQVLLSGQTILGPSPQNLLPQVPYADFIQAMAVGLPELIAEAESDTRNILLTLARIWFTLETDTIYSKPEAANWVITRLPKEYQPVLQRARDICLGEEEEYWEDLHTFIKPCVDFISSKINELMSIYQSTNSIDKSIKIKP